MFPKIFFICLLLSPQFATAVSYTLTITAQELQEKLSKALPIKREVPYISAKIYDSQVDLIEGTKQVGLFTKLDLVALGSIKSAGQAYVKGEITYNPEKRGIYLINPNIVSVTTDNIPPNLMPEIKKIAQLSLEKAVQIYPIYSFKDEKIQAKMANSVLESIQIKKQTIVIKMTLL